MCFQIVTANPGEITWRILSCFCSAPHSCDCFSPQTVTIQQTEADKEHTSTSSSTSAHSNTSHSTMQPIADLHEGLIGKWCAVRYDGDAYPGIIQDVDAGSGALVKTMNRVGPNRFFWPMRDDIIWYELENVLGLVPEPLPVTKRHTMLNASVWEEICSLLAN